jgi:hypothetical protein
VTDWEPRVLGEECPRLIMTGIRADKSTIVVARLKHTGLYRLYRSVRLLWQLCIWVLRGRPVPPPFLIKQRTIKEYARRYAIDTLVETGTYLGQTVEANIHVFRRIVSIELDRELCEQAQEKFAGYRHVSIIQGHSGNVLSKVLANINGPCLLWLDAHYSGGITARADTDTPIAAELEAVLGSSIDGHVALVDDARLFVGRDGYPTMSELHKFVSERRPDWTVEVKNDIIRMHRRRS